MGKFYTLLGSFLVGVSTVGLFSFTAYAFETLRMYSFWLVVVVALVLLAGAVADEFFAEALGLSIQQYIGWMIATVVILILGGTIAWVR